MPDPWEYPWFAAWDLAFHSVVWAHLDPAFAKYQLLVLLREWFLHPNGALPAYEWSFDDVNPPVHALAAIRVFVIDGGTDLDFLERVFQKLLLNFTWWLNRQDPDGNNLFGGGFLGLDNISPIDRSHLPPGCGSSRPTAPRGWPTTRWRCSGSRSRSPDDDDVYEDMVVKFVEQFVMVLERSRPRAATTPRTASSTTAPRRTRHRRPIRVQTLVGVIPALPGRRRPDPEHSERIRRLREAVRPPDGTGRRHEVAAWQVRGSGRLATVARVGRVAGPAARMLARLFDENAFLSPHGLRSLSKRHTTPYGVPGVPGAVIDYEPAESRTAMYGGNSNWRGPVWFPVNYLVIRALLQYDEFFGDDFTIEYPTGSGRTAHPARDCRRPRGATHRDLAPRA